MIIDKCILLAMFWNVLPHLQKSAINVEWCTYHRNHKDIFCCVNENKKLYCLMWRVKMYIENIYWNTVKMHKTMKTDLNHQIAFYDIKHLR